MEGSPSSSPGRLNNKVAIVTGSSSGIDCAITLAYIHEGAKVVCGDITTNARYEINHETTNTTLEILQQEGGKESSIAIEADGSISKDVQALVDETVKRFG